MAPRSGAQQRRYGMSRSLRRHPVSSAAPYAKRAAGAPETRGIFDWKQSPGDEPGTLADAMDGTTPENIPEEEADFKSV